MPPHRRRATICALFIAIAVVPFAAGADASSGNEENRAISADRAESMQNVSVALAKGSPLPSYPDILMRAGMSGVVAIEVAIDTSGVADTSSYKVLTSSQPLLAIAVRNSITSMRFVPAKRGGRKVAQVTRIGFRFVADGRASGDSTRYPLEIVIKPHGGVNR